MGDIAISAAVRQNLLALQNTAKLMEVTQSRLATGKRVNSALDNPANYFTAAAMSNRAGDLSNILDSMKTAVNTLKAADNAITAITKLVESAQGTARQALQDASSMTAASIVGETALGGATSKATAEAKKMVGDLGFDAADTFTLTATINGVDTSETFTIDSTTTVKDFVDDINSKLGSVLTASVTSDGYLSIVGQDGASLKIDINDDTTTNNDLQDLFGATATINGTAGTSVNATDTQTINAPSSSTNLTRQSLAEQFNAILDQISDLAEDAEFNGINLLDGDNLKVVFNEKTGSNENSLTITGVTFDYEGLGISKSTGDFQTDAEINTRLDQLNSALTKLRNQASEFGSNLTTVQTRQDFTTAMINTLETGASDLTLADTNLEGANMLALQTRQQLSTTALSLASQADQAVLRFLR